VMTLAYYNYVFGIMLPKYFGLSVLS